MQYLCFKYSFTLNGIFRLDSSLVNENKLFMCMTEKQRSHAMFLLSLIDPDNTSNVLRYKIFVKGKFNKKTIFKQIQL